MKTTEKKLQDQEAIAKFKHLVNDVNICMFTTLDNEHNIISCPMSTIEVDEEGNAWFFTNEFSEKIQEASQDNAVHLIYSHPVKNVYVNVKGTCSVIIDRSKMEKLWNPNMKAWFPDGLDDAKICLLKVTTESAHYWNHSASKMSVFFHMLKSITKGDTYKEGEKGKLSLQS